MDRSADAVSPDLPPARLLAQRLIDLSRRPANAGMTRAAAAALAGERLHQALSRWIGIEGCHALFSRARAEEQVGNPPLVVLLLRARSAPYIEGVAESVAEYGETSTANAIEAMLVSIIDVLGRLIGVDMATNLIERSLRESASDDAGQDKRRAQA